MSAVGGGPIVTLMNLLATSAQYSYVTLGNTNGTGFNAPASADRAWISEFHCSYNGTITDLHVKLVGTGAGTAQVKLFVTDDSAGNPLNVLGITSGQAAGTQTQMDFTGLSISVVSGDLHLGFVSSAGGYPNPLANYVGKLQRSEGFTFASPPSTVGTIAETDTGQQLAIWATVKF